MKIHALNTVSEITEKEVIAAQQAWGNGLVTIGKFVQNPYEAKREAELFLQTVYDFSAPVCFKPTKASKNPFRSTFEGALSYFVGDNQAFPEDHGFALTPWEQVVFDNATINLWGNWAQACGLYTFTATDGSQVVVEYTFTYKKDTAGNLRIVGHHSSLPYQD